VLESVRMTRMKRRGKHGKAVAILINKDVLFM